MRTRPTGLLHRAWRSGAAASRRARLSALMSGLLYALAGGPRWQPGRLFASQRGGELAASLRGRALATLAGALLPAVPLNAQEQFPAAEAGLPRSATMLGIALQPSVNHFSYTGLALGRLLVPFADDRWVFRANLEAGWESRALYAVRPDAQLRQVTERSPFAGVHSAALRTWSHDMLARQGVRVDLYLVVGADLGLFGRFADETARNTLVPGISAGAGFVRHRSLPGGRVTAPVFAEFVREQSFGGRESRTLFRMGVTWHGLPRRPWWVPRAPPLPAGPRTRAAPLRRSELEHHTFTYRQMPHATAQRLREAMGPRLWSGAVESTLKSLESRPDSLQLIHRLATSEAMLGRHRPAFRAFRLALDHPDAQGRTRARIHFDVSVLFAAIGLPDSAFKHLDLALATEPLLEAALVNRGVLLEELGQGLAAIAAYEEAAALRPNSIAIWENLAYARMRADLPAEALTALDRALTLRAERGEFPGERPDRQRCVALALYRGLAGEDWIRDFLCPPAEPKPAPTLLPRR